MKFAVPCFSLFAARADQGRGGESGASRRGDGVTAAGCQRTKAKSRSLVGCAGCHDVEGGQVRVTGMITVFRPIEMRGIQSEVRRACFFVLRSAR